MTFTTGDFLNHLTVYNHAVQNVRSMYYNSYYTIFNTDEQI